MSNVVFSSAAAFTSIAIYNVVTAFREQCLGPFLDRPGSDIAFGYGYVWRHVDRHSISDR